MTGFFEPNSADAAAGIGANFGTTTNVINGALECGYSQWNGKAAARAEYFTEWLKYF